MVHGGLRPARAEPSRMTESSLFGILMVVTLMVVTLMVVTLRVVTLRVSTLMVSTLVVAQSFGGVEIVEVNLRAGCVEDAGLLQDCRKRLATSDLGHHVGDLTALVDCLGTLGLDLDVGPELLKAVELRGKLGELVVELWKDTLLDRLNGHVDLGVLALVLATRQRGVEEIALLGGHHDKSDVEAIDHVAGADLVGDALGRVDLFLANRSREVYGHEVTHGSHSLNTGQSTDCLLYTSPSPRDG